LVGDFLALGTGLTTSFFRAFFADAFLAAAVLAFDALVVPVTAFFAGARLLATVIFFAGDLGLGLPARTFLAAAGFLGATLDLTAFFAVVVLGVVLATILGAGGAFGLALVVTADLSLEAGLLGVGLFSLDEVSAGLDLGANLTLPEGPLGRTKTPFSAPAVIAFASCVDWAAPISSLYLVSTYFLIWGRETPMRASSVLMAIHSLIMSAQVGCDGAALVAADFFVADLVTAGFLADIFAIYN